MSVAYTGDGITFADGTNIASGRNGMVNRIINGAMVIDQRNSGASVTATGSNYALDRWQMLASATSKFTVQQNAGSVTPPAGFTNYLGVTSSAATSLGATDYYTITQKIEGFNNADMGWGTANAKTVTISFWVRSSLTGTFGFVLRNSAGNRCYPASYTISAANTWEQKSVTLDGDTTGTWATDNSIGIELDFGLGVGSTYSNTAGTWTTGGLGVTGATSVVGTSGATFYITGVDLRAGTYATAPTWEFRSISQELALCQRYYQLAEGMGGTSYATSSIGCDVQFKTEMRANPTLLATAPVQITYAGVNDYTQSSANATLTGGRVTTRGIQFSLGNFTGLTNSIYHCQNVGFNNAAVALNAEL